MTRTSSGSSPSSSPSRKSRSIAVRNAARVLPAPDRAPAVELRIGRRQYGAAGRIRKAGFPPALDDGMEIVGKHSNILDSGGHPKFQPETRTAPRRCYSCTTGHIGCTVQAVGGETSESVEQDGLALPIERY